MGEKPLKSVDFRGFLVEQYESIESAVRDGRCESKRTAGAQHLNKQAVKNIEKASKSADSEAFGTNVHNVLN